MPVIPDTLILPRAYLAQCLSARACREAVEDALKIWARGDIELAPVGYMQGEGGAFHSKSAIRLVTPRLAAIKINGNFPANPASFGLPTIQGFVALLDAVRGNVLALMDSTEITAKRTAAASAVAAMLLARVDATHVAFVGCGLQAHYHFDALRDLFVIKRVTCFDLDEARAASFMATAAANGIEAQVSQSAREAAIDADIIVTCTPSQTPLLGERDVKRGCFVAAVGADSPGKQELDPSLMKAARVVPDSVAQAAEMGDLHHAIEAGLMEAIDIHGELADIVVGRVSRRTNDDEIFVFDSTGIAVEDLALAMLAYRVAEHDPAVLTVPLCA